MNNCDGFALLTALLTTLAGFFGFGLNHLFETERQEIQRAHDHQERRREVRRNTLEKLQLALAAVKDGSGTATLLHFASDDTGAEVTRATLEAPWFRDWQEGAQKVSILVAQLGDQELRELAHSVGVGMDEFRVAKGDQNAIQAALKHLDEAYEQANDLAGQRIHDLDAEEPVSTRRFTWWRRY